MPISISTLCSLTTDMVFFLAQGISVARHYYVVLSHGLSCDLDITLSQTPILNISQQSVPCMNKWYSLDNIASISL